MLQRVETDLEALLDVQDPDASGDNRIIAGRGNLRGHHNNPTVDVELQRFGGFVQSSGRLR